MKPGNRLFVSVPIPAGFVKILKDEEKSKPLHFKRFFILLKNMGG